MEELFRRVLNLNSVFAVQTQFLDVCLPNFFHYVF